MLEARFHKQSDKNERPERKIIRFFLFLYQRFLQPTCLLVNNEFHPTYKTFLSKSTYFHPHLDKIHPIFVQIYTFYPHLDKIRFSIPRYTFPHEKLLLYTTSPERTTSFQSVQHLSIAVFAYAKNFSLGNFIISKLILNCSHLISFFLNEAKRNVFSPTERRTFSGEGVFLLISFR